MSTAKRDVNTLASGLTIPTAADLNLKFAIAPQKSCLVSTHHTSELHNPSSPFDDQTAPMQE